MSYYPIHEPYHLNRYYYPHYAPHLHSEFANIYGLQVAKAQSQIDFLYQSNLELNQIHNRRKLYESVTRQSIQRQIQLGKVIQSEKINNELQRLQIRQSLIDEQLFRQSQLRKYHQHDVLMKNTYNNYFSNSKDKFQSGDLNITHSEYKAKDNLFNKENKSNQKNRSISYGQILNIRPNEYKQSHQKDKNQHDGTIYQPKDYKTQVKSQIKDISYVQNEKSDKESKQKSILKSNKNKTNSNLKKSKRVKFIEYMDSSNEKSNKQDDSMGDILKSKDKQICLNNSKIKQAYRDRRSNTSNSKNLKSSRKNMPLKISRSNIPPLNASKRIQNRLKLSSIVYKDSEYRNIKHQMSHLFNTYDVQIKIRNQLKKKFNEDPTIIAKFNITKQS